MHRAKVYSVATEIVNICKKYQLTYKQAHDLVGSILSLFKDVILTEDMPSSAPPSSD